MSRDELGSLIASIGMDYVNFKSGITEINRNMRVLKSEFKATEAVMGPLGSSMDGLQYKSENLTKQINLQQIKVNKLADVHKKARLEKGEDSKATQNLAIRLNREISYLAKLEKQLENTNSEMNNLTKLTQKASIDFKKFGSDFQSVGQAMSKVGSVWSVAITAPLLLIGKKSLSAASDVKESEDMFNVALGNMADDARRYSNEISDSLGLNEYAIRENIAVLYDMSKAMGVTSHDASEMAKNLTKRAYDIASFKNLKPEEAFEKIQAALSGEGEGMKRLGYVINETTTKAYAYKTGIAKVGDELTESQKVFARYKLMMEQTSNAQDNLARTLESPANQARISKEKFAELSAEIGEKLIPVQTELLETGNDIMSFFKGLNEEQTELVVKIGLVAAAMGPALLITGKLIKSIGLLIEYGPKIKASFLAFTSNPVLMALAGVATAFAIISIGVMEARAAAAEFNAEIERAVDLELGKSKQAIEDKYNSKINSIKNEMSAEQEAHEERLRMFDEEFESKLEASKNYEKARREALKDQLSDLNQAHKDAIQLIRDEYGVYEEKQKSKTDLAREQADNEIEAAEKAYNKKIELLDKEYAKRLQNLDAETRRKIKEVKSQIDAINNQTKEEEKLLKEQRNKEKELSLKKRIEQEDDADRKKELEKELAEFLAELQREKLLEQRELEKEALEERITAIETSAKTAEEVLKEELKTRKEELDEQLKNEINDINTKRDAEIEAIQAERIEKENAENKKYLAAKTRIDNEIAQLEGYSERAAIELQKQLDEKQRIENEKYLATEERVNKELAKIEELKQAEIERIEEQKQARVEALKEEARQQEIQAINAQKEYLSYDLEGQSNVGIVNIPGRAIGDPYWQGGLVKLHEHGGEIVRLERGAEIIPHDISMEMARNSKGQTVIFNNTIKSNRALNQSEIVQQMRKEQQQMAMQLQYATQ